MKARIQQEPRCVLLWQVAPGSAEHAAVEHAARLSRLKVRLLTAADLGTTMEAWTRRGVERSSRCPPLPCCSSGTTRASWRCNAQRADRGGCKPSQHLAPS